MSAIWVFVDLAEDVETADHITVMDLQWANWMHSHATPALTRMMVAVSTLHDMLSMSVLTILLAIFPKWRRRHGWFLGLLLAVPGGWVLNTFFKFVFAQARPLFTDPLVTVISYSFPSGRVASSTLFYGFVAGMLVIILVAASRMYPGAHFFSDVLAAFFESVAWLGICLVGIHLIRAHTAKPERRIRWPPQEIVDLLHSEAGCGQESDEVAAIEDEFREVGQTSRVAACVQMPL
jgi:membrane-associated phospholipid phosphatase